MKLGPFNLKEAMAGKPLATASGIKLVSFWRDGAYSTYSHYQFAYRVEGKPQLNHCDASGIAKGDSSYDVHRVLPEEAWAFKGLPKGVKADLGVKMELHDFNLKAALGGAVVLTRDGQLVDELYPTDEDEQGPNNLAQYCGTLFGRKSFFTAGGKYTDGIGTSAEHMHDLFMAVMAEDQEKPGKESTPHYPNDFSFKHPFFGYASQLQVYSEIKGLGWEVSLKSRGIGEDGFIVNVTSPKHRNIAFSYGVDNRMNFRGDLVQEILVGMLHKIKQCSGIV